VLHLAARHALKAEALALEHLQDLRVPIGFHRIEDGVDTRKRFERLRASLERLAVVDESSAVLAAEREQLPGLRSKKRTLAITP
jgi:hypothetical protein